MTTPHHPMKGIIVTKMQKFKKWVTENQETILIGSIMTARICRPTKLSAKMAASNNSRPWLRQPTWALGIVDSLSAEHTVSAGNP